jgi:hypothetical protein
LTVDLRGSADQAAVGNAIDAPIGGILFGARYRVPSRLERIEWGK